MQQWRLLGECQDPKDLASVDDSATVGWNLVLYAIVPLATWMQMPLKERLVFMQVA
jgi:hypothetical protein